MLKIYFLHAVGQCDVNTLWPTVLAREIMQKNEMFFVQVLLL